MSKMECVTVQEGFYLVTISWLGAGCLWFCWLLWAVRYLQATLQGDWRMRSTGDRRVLNREQGNKQEQIPLKIA